MPSGIITLSARITEDLVITKPWEATQQAAYILYASVDEYGLHEHSKHMLPTHHQLFKQMTEKLGLSDQQVLGEDYVDPAGLRMGQLTRDYYCNLSLGQALGFHLASEMTSSREFRHFLRAFQAHAETYGLEGENDPVLLFFKIHCEVEPMHVSTGKDILAYFLAQDSQVEADAMEGAMTFMEGFGAMFESINERVTALRLRQ